MQFLLCGSESRWNFYTMFRCRRKVEKLRGHQIWGQGGSHPQNFFSQKCVFSNDRSKKRIFRRKNWKKEGRPHPLPL